MDCSKRIGFKDALAFVLDGNQLDISGFSSDEDDDKLKDDSVLLNRLKTDEEIMGQSNELKKHVYRWQKKDIPVHSGIFTPDISENEDNTIKNTFGKFQDVLARQAD